jgi:hypothetical protein
MEIPLTLVHWWCPVLIWLVLLGFFWAVCLAIQDGIYRLKRLHQIPCNRCIFYTGEYRLKCTVNPYRAFTEDAIACRDWESRKNSSSCNCPTRTRIFKFFKSK